MQTVVCIKWKCASTEYKIRFIAYDLDSLLGLVFKLRSSTPDWKDVVARLAMQLCI